MSERGAEVCQTESSLPFRKVTASSAVFTIFASTDFLSASLKPFHGWSQS